MNPFDLMELVRRTPHGPLGPTRATFRYTHPVSMMMIALGQHTRAGIEDNLWDVKKGVRITTMHMIQKHINMANETGPPDRHGRTDAADVEDRRYLQVH